MRPCRLRRVQEDRWEAVLDGSSLPLFAFDNEADVAAFIETLGPERVERENGAPQAQQARCCALPL